MQQTLCEMSKAQREKKTLESGKIKSGRSPRVVQQICGCFVFLLAALQQAQGKYVDDPAFIYTGMNMSLVERGCSLGKRGGQGGGEWGGRGAKIPTSSFPSFIWFQVFCFFLQESPLSKHQ